ncbi:histidine phosphatase family protein [Agromyces seonyuensis]|uniref:Histidine phosphatase family protein n=1 Tax=Agromyces seonyuensis TaxID=2662446 RepID=A0A6I4P0C0_9MICO|nr:histidine phosphatase family protein [Agromyces seonyuensis]
MSFRILLVRHGETDWNAAGRVQGTTDIPLNDRGRAQAAGLAARLADSAERARIVRVVASPLQRAADTAAAIAASLGLPVSELDADLAEQHFGAFEGRTWADVHAEHEGPLPGVESHEDAIARVTAALTRHAVPEGTLLAVSHGGVINAINARLAARPEDYVRAENVSVHEYTLTGGRLERVPASTEDAA